MSAHGSHISVTKKTPIEKTAGAETSLLARVDALTTSAEFKSALDFAVKVKQCLVNGRTRCCCCSGVAFAAVAGVGI